MEFFVSFMSQFQIISLYNLWFIMILCKKPKNSRFLIKVFLPILKKIQKIPFSDNLLANSSSLGIYE